MSSALEETLYSGLAWFHGTFYPTTTTPLLLCLISSYSRPVMLQCRLRMLKIKHFTILVKCLCKFCVTTCSTLDRKSLLSWTHLGLSNSHFLVAEAFQHFCLVIPAGMTIQLSKVKGMPCYCLPVTFSA